MTNTGSERHGPDGTDRTDPTDDHGGTDRRRPVERRVLRWAESGLDDAEIARRFGRGERWAAQVRFLARLDRPPPAARRQDRLRPIERRLLRWRQAGADHEALSDRFRRSPEFLARVEEYANYKLTNA